MKRFMVLAGVLFLGVLVTAGAVDIVLYNGLKTIGASGMFEPFPTDFSIVSRIASRSDPSAPAVVSVVQKDSSRVGFTCEGMLLDAAGNLLLQVTVTNRSTGVPSVKNLYVLKDPEYISQAVGTAIAELIAGSHEADYASRLPSPPLVDTVGTEALVQYQDIQTTATPMKGDVLPNGNLIVGLGQGLLELGRRFNVVSNPGYPLNQAGNYSFAYYVSATPSGTILAKGNLGSEMYRYYPGVMQPEMLRDSSDGTSPVYIMPDGNIVTFDVMQKKISILKNRKRTVLTGMYPSAYSNVTAIDVSDEGLIWVFDSTNKHVRVYTAEGAMVDMIPVCGPATIGPTVFAVHPQGGFLLGGMDKLVRYDRYGYPVWILNSIPDPLGGDRSFPAVFNIAAGRDGFYLLNMLGKQISYFSDPGTEVADDFVREQIRLNSRLTGGAEDAEILVRKAELYRSEGAREPALYLYEQAVAIDPYLDAAADGYSGVEAELLLERAHVLKQRAEEMLVSIGRISAQPVQIQALQAFEQARSRGANAEEIRDAMDSLEALFADAASGVRKPELVISDIPRFALFPSLMGVYRDKPAAFLKVSNPLGAVTDVKVQFYIPRFMDFPAGDGKSYSIAKGTEVELPLFALLSDQVLEIQEDLPVQARITLSFTLNGKSYEQTRIMPVLLYRRTAISWTETARIAAFITPNESVIEEFSHAAARLTDQISVTPYGSLFLRAAAVIEALGMYRISYVEDPQTPISAVKDSGTIDTVRFARTTLMLRSGDCDDSTVLLSSLLESVGVSTAIITTPGHIFLAFDSGEAPENAWLFSDPQLPVIQRDGKLWVPVETTVLSDGFTEAWKTAGDLITRHPDYEFLPLNVIRQMYPPIPLPSSGITFRFPSPEEVLPRLSSVKMNLDKRFYDVAITSLESRIASLPPRDRNADRLRIQVGVLKARYGRTDEALAVFNAGIAANPGQLAFWVNAANLYLDTGKPSDALALLQKAVVRFPSSVSVHLALARAYSGLGNRPKTEEALARVRESAPLLADRYAPLLGASDSASASRGADVTSVVPTIWVPADF